MEDYKIKVQQAINERQLSSGMNNTKWRGLQSAVKEEFPITPSFQVKFLIDYYAILKILEKKIGIREIWKKGLNLFLR